MTAIKNNWPVLVLCLLLMGGGQTKAQTIFSDPHIFFQDTASIVDIQMADYNNDGYMDAVLQMHDTASNSLVVLFPKDSLFWGVPITLYNDTLDIYDWIITDLDNNNRVDLVIYSQSPSEEAPILRTIYNILDSTSQSDFQLTNISEAGSIFSADFDQNGWRDLAVSTASLDIFYQDNGQFTNYSIDYLKDKVLRASVVDYNNDTKKDFLVTLQDNTSTYSEFWINNGSFLPDKSNHLQPVKLMDEMDVNADGSPDYLVYTDSSNFELYYRDSDRLDLHLSQYINDINRDINNAKDLFLADFNADGLTDLFVGADTSRIFFQFSDSTFYEMELELPKYNSIAFAHLNTDGNLDLIISSQESPNNNLSFFINTTSIINQGPSPDFLSAGLFVNGDLRLFWEASTDDYTAAPSNTYDVLVQGKTQSDFDWTNYERLLLNKGNAGYAQEFVVKNVSPGQIEYAIQAIDNSYESVSLREGEGGGICRGEVQICEASEYKFQYLCGPRQVEFNFPETRAWYSAAQGFLGFSNGFSHYLQANDTLYSVLPFALSCHDQQAWIIQSVQELNLTTTGDTSLCVGATFVYQLDSSVWVSALWKSTNGFLSDSLYIHYQVIENDTLFLEAINRHSGCSAFDTLALNVTPLEINLWQDTTICLHTTLGYELPHTEWQSALWRNHNLDTLSTSFVLTLAPIEPDTIYINAISTQGCIAADTIHIEVEEAIASVIEQNITIYKGELANLQANGGLYYEWFPDTDLNNPYVANPQSSALESIVYHVSVSSALGCSDTAQVNITVLNQAFASNLFSPNSDGSNDSWRIIELEDVSQFRLVVVDREGQIMYETNQEYEAANLGWDGTKNGTPQPAGVYFWKVSGRYVQGNDITLNGAKEGQILLMR